MKRADGELLELGELARMLRWVDEVWEMYAAEVPRRGTWPEDRAEWTWRDAAAYCAARECVERETEIGAAYSASASAFRKMTGSSGWHAIIKSLSSRRITTLRLRG
jgi:hypothetical protein